jgi:putative oxidoreductase
MNKVLLALRVVLAAVFLYAGLIKALSSAEFAMALLPFTFVPENWIGPLARLLPISEVVAGLLVLPPWTSRFGAALILLLCAAFITALGWALANDIIVACSCFGNDEEPSRATMIAAIVRDVGLAAMAAVVLVVSTKRGARAE